MEKLITSLNLREKTVLDRLARGWSLEEVAEELDTNPLNIKLTCSTAQEKLGARTVAQAVAYATWSRAIYPFDMPVSKTNPRRGGRVKSTGAERRTG